MEAEPEIFADLGTTLGINQFHYCLAINSFSRPMMVGFHPRHLWCLWLTRGWNHTANGGDQDSPVQDNLVFTSNP